MEARHLIDGIVRQTTVLIARLSTVAGIRAPLSRIADEVFLSLSRELESQGVTRKVAADMFGLALRSYQLKINRLTASAGTSEQTLWESVIEHLRSSGGASRAALFARFARDDPADVGAVLKDLVDSGLVSRTGRPGDHAYYQLTSGDVVVAMEEEQRLETITHLVWLEIYDRQQVTRAKLIHELRFAEADTVRAIEALLHDGRVDLETRAGEELLVCRRMAIPVGSELGWEVAVFDHFRAVATAIASKLERHGPRSRHGDVVGGTTLSFTIHGGHPFESEVYGLLARVRGELNELWHRVVEFNNEHPCDPAERVEVTFYFGQTVPASEKERTEGSNPPPQSSGSGK